MLSPRRTVAVHPGEILLEILEQNQISQSALAEHLRISHSTVNEICRGRRGVTPDMAMKLSRAFNQNVSFWLNLQKNWELSQLDERIYQSIQPILQVA